MSGQSPPVKKTLRKLMDVHPDCTRLERETIIPFDTADQAMRWANDTRSGLASGPQRQHGRRAAERRDQPIGT